MGRSVVPILVAVGVALAVGVWIIDRRSPSTSETVFQPPSRLIEPAPVCPWRDPDGDLPRLFPGARRTQTVTLILSGARLELQQRLGRAPNPDESSLTAHRVFEDGQCVGTVLTRRVKGEHGAIELVLAIGTDHRVRGLRLQRLREPEQIADALNNPAWLGGFVGKGLEADWQAGAGLPALPAVARNSGRAITEGVRSLLVLLAVADQAGRPGLHH